jgi:hypothetical protein
MCSEASPPYLEINYIILFICRYGGDAAVQILYSVGMVWGGLIILSCLFVGRGRCHNTDTEYNICIAASPPYLQINKIM